MNLTCAIIDDEPLAISLLDSYVRKTPFLDLAGKYASAVQALAALQAAPVDLLFLDIQMPELSGLEFSRMLDASTRIIFTTAFDQYAVDSYKVNALDYLLKPISYPDFLQSVTKALQWFELVKKGEGASVAGEGSGVPGASASAAVPGVSEASGADSAVAVPMFAPDNRMPEPERIFIKTEYKLVQLELGKILYIEGLKDYVKIYTEDDPHPVLSLMSMKSMEEMLPASRFIRVHRSFIVQPGKIKVIERNRIVFGKTYIPISDNYRQKFFDFLAIRSLMPKL